MVRVVIVAVVFMLINKQTLMGFGLNKQENTVHGRRNHRHQQRLPGAKVRARQRHGKHQHDNRQRKQGDKILLNAEQIHILGGEFTPAQQQGKTDQTAGDDHNDGVERVTHQGRRGVAGGH